MLGDEVENLVSVVYHLDGVLHKNLEMSRKLQRLRTDSDIMTVNESRGLEVAGYFCKFNYRIEDYFYLYVKLECSEGSVQFVLTTDFDYKVVIGDISVTLTNIDLAKAMIDAFIEALLK